MNDVIVMSHPLIQHKLSLLRDKKTGGKEFREVVSELSMLMCYEATRDLPLTEIEVESPMCVTRTQVISGKKLAVVPILRAGLGMADGVLKLIPSAKQGHIGVYRDPETLKPVEYYCKMPADIQERNILVLDPMLATGGTASTAIHFLKNYRCRSVKLLTLVCAPEGVAVIQRDHPDVQIYTCSIDERLDENGYIIPGLGDVGDRIFGTK